MTLNDAIEKLTQLRTEDPVTKFFRKIDNEVVDEQKELIDICLQALEKQIPKAPEPQIRHSRYYEEVTEWFCPTCGCLVDKDEDVYCSYCGQRLE